jgi:hypothetical protein
MYLRLRSIAMDRVRGKYLMILRGFVGSLCVLLQVSRDCATNALCELPGRVLDLECRAGWPAEEIRPSRGLNVQPSLCYLRPR